MIKSLLVASSIVTVISLCGVAQAGENYTIQFLCPGKTPIKNVGGGNNYISFSNWVTDNAGVYPIQSNGIVQIPKAQYNYDLTMPLSAFTVAMEDVGYCPNSDMQNPSGHYEASNIILKNNSTVVVRMLSSPQ